MALLKFFNQLRKCVSNSHHSTSHTSILHPNLMLPVSIEDVQRFFADFTKTSLAALAIKAERFCLFGIHKFSF